MYQLALNLVHTYTCAQLTKEAGPWMPRMERMVQSRGLCEFEKKIVITLIGSVIQPNKVDLHVHIIIRKHFLL